MAVSHEQTAAPGAQGGVEFDERFADELDTPVAARQLVENVAIQYENAVHPTRPAHGFGKRCVVVITQVAAEPDQHGIESAQNKIPPSWYRLPPAIKMKAMQSVNLTDHFLIAMPAMTDSYFAKTLVYVAEHNEQGALGVIVNRPLDLTLESLFEKVDIKLEVEGFGPLPVYFGGPVQTDRGFVLHRPVGKWQSTLAVNTHIGLTSSRDVLQHLAREGEPHDVLITLGYAGWGAGQLEEELAANAWLTVPADPGILFELPFEDRLGSALELLGVDFTSLVEGAGHA